MFKTKPLQILITTVPLIVLFLVSAYFASTSWERYQNNVKLENKLGNAYLLQEYENVLLRDVLCDFIMSENTNVIMKICKKRKEMTREVLNRIKAKDGNLSIEEDISRIKNNISKYSPDHFVKLLGRDSVVSSVTQYLDKMKLNTDSIEDKALLKLYMKLSDITYATELENFLVTYYITKKTSVSTDNMIFWDKIIEASYLPDIENIDNIPSVKAKLLKIIQNNSLQSIFAKLDDMRITILSGAMKQSDNNIDWVVSLTKKQKILNQLKLIVGEEIYKRIVKDKENALWMFLFYVALILLSLFSLWYVYIQKKKEKKENTELMQMVQKINTLSSDDESNVKTIDDIQNKEEIYKQIENNFLLLQQKEKEAKEEAVIKSDFLSTLSHEIRTPLNGIIGFSKLLKELGTTVEQEEFLSLIEGSSNNLISIVNDILDLSKINADKMKIENTTLDLFDTIEETVATLTQQAHQKDIELGLFIDPFLSYYFLGDKTKLSQIMTNLISNAIKFTDEYGKVNIFVQCMNDSEDEAQIKFAVNDSGIGLSQEQIKNIFNAFSQATTGTSKKYGGTGLGLTISSKMVELMGGELKVESSINKGSTFYFTLTLKKDKENTFKPYPKFPNVKVGFALPVKSIKRQLDSNLETYIRHLGAHFEIYYYEDLFESFKIFELPDIMIFDHHYARLSGELEQCASIDCKSILLTDATLQSRINPEKHQFTDIMYMPVTLRKSIRILNSMIESPEKDIVQTNKLDNIESFEGLTALIADDNTINRKLIKIIMEKLGLTVIMVSDGEEAFQQYQEHRFDIIFMDIEMPIINGIEATHKIVEYERQNNLKHVPIVALTANVSAGGKEYYMNEGMDDYATKPLDIDMLKSIISKHCIA